MPRKLRIQYLAALYHVMSRANGRGNIFRADVDRQDFLKTLAAQSLIMKVSSLAPRADS